MAQAQKSKAGTKKVDSATIFSSTISAIADPAIDKKSSYYKYNPKGANTSEQAAANTINLWTVMKIVYGGRPKEGTKNRAIYDEAVAKLGGKDPDLALAKLNVALAQSIVRTTQLAAKEDQTGTEVFGKKNGPRLYDMVEQAQNGLMYDTEMYRGLKPVESHLQMLRRFCEGGKIEQDVSEVPEGLLQPTVRVALPITPPAEDRIGPVTIVTGKENAPYQAVDIPAGPLTQMLFGDADAAQAAYDSSANVHAVMANYPDDYDRRVAAGNDLADHLVGSADGSIQGIPEGRPIRSDPDFNRAIELFRQGDLEGGMRALAESGDPGLNQMVSSTGELLVLDLEQRSITLINIGARVVIHDTENEEVFESVRRAYASGEKSKKGLSFRHLRFIAGARYIPYAMHALFQRYRIDPNTLEKVEIRGDRVSVLAKGQRFEGTIEEVLGGTIAGEPTELVLHLSAGIDKKDAGAIAEYPDGTRETLKLDDKYRYYWGLVGGELRFRGSRGGSSTEGIHLGGGFALAGVGIGRYGVTGKARSNLLGYFTISRNLWEGENKEARMDFFATPQFSTFLDEFRAGGKISFVRTSRPGGGARKWYIGATPGYEFNTVTGVHTYYLQGRLGDQGLIWKPMNIELSLGVTNASGGAAEYERTPTAVVAGLGFTFHIGEPKPVATPQPEEAPRIPPQTVPKKTPKPKTSGKAEAEKTGTVKLGGRPKKTEGEE